MIPPLPDCNNVLVVAPVSSGKSWLLKQWINSLQRSLFIDITAESLDGAYSHHVWHSPKHLGEILEENPFYYRIAYHPSSRNFLLDFQWAVDLMWTTTGNGLSLSRWLIIDEIHELEMTEPMDRIVRYARHDLLGFIGATQKFSDVSTLTRDNTRMFVLFHNQDDIELKAIRGKFGKVGEEKVRNLRPLIYDEANKKVIQTPQCLVWNRGYGLSVYDLGESTNVEQPIKPQENEECQDKPLKEVPSEVAVPSSEHHTGIPENQ